MGPCIRHAHAVPPHVCCNNAVRKRGQPSVQSAWLRRRRLRRRLLHHRLRLRLLLRLHGRGKCRGLLPARAVDPAASLAVPVRVVLRRPAVRLRHGSCCDGGIGGAALPARHLTDHKWWRQTMDATPLSEEGELSEGASCHSAILNRTAGHYLSFDSIEERDSDERSPDKFQTGRGGRPPLK